MQGELGGKELDCARGKAQGQTGGSEAPWMGDTWAGQRGTRDYITIWWQLACDCFPHTG